MYIFIYILLASVCPCRLTTCDLLWIGLLVLYILLWTEPTCWRDLPCVSALPHCRWLHWPIQLWALLSRSAVKRQPQLSSWAHAQTHRYSVYYPVTLELWCKVVFPSWGTRTSGYSTRQCYNPTWYFGSWFLNDSNQRSPKVTRVQARWSHQDLGHRPS